MTAASPLAQLTPTSLWRHFQMLCDTPRPSKQEQAVVDKILSFAKRHNLDAQLDQVGNVIIRKAATPGMENRQTVVLQSHLDMVTQKNNDKHHDFARDPITPVAAGDWIRADGTTLGADNGIGVAAILALLESQDIPHGPLEALLTIDEEAGMTGAKGLSPNLLQGSLLFNLDTEAEGELYVGCAGGIDVNACLEIEWQATEVTQTALTLEVRGLLGGHSGLDIHLGRGNANQLAALFIARLSDALPVQIASFNGGSLRNAIPREAEAGLVVPSQLLDAVKAAFNKFKADMQQSYQQVEPRLALSLSETPQRPEQAMSSVQSRLLCSALLTCPSHPLRMSDSLPGVVETSNNLARVRFEGAKVEICCLVRSLTDVARDDLAANLCRHFQMIGADSITKGAYPGWTPNMASPLLAVMREVYRNKYHKEPAIKVIHAGLECGLLGAIYPEWDMISFGPTIHCAHSPDEKVHIASVAGFWDCLIAGLAAVPLANNKGAA
ncbi:aminoacyl-histidine dipeptidase [Simiduia curdlanivorans]|uniref:Aminoacyl-histidine dipeptidase n=1 Tax=Simiduia curdlanivorans TaxID=1492769 RepID=A0ABV8V0T6_9GAMM|nr:aminoacyl-histidine dipeptidase [Simiduia curdlanivorans]MDN3639201.1 aminoacyl-histidine dipeptidase [Simiduia curdlanivorans]